MRLTNYAQNNNKHTPSIKGRKLMSKMPEKEDDNQNKLNRNKFEGFAKEQGYATESERLTTGTRTTIGFLSMGTGTNFFINLSEKVKDLKQFLEDFKLESKELEQDEFIKLCNHNPEDNKIHVKKYKDAVYIGEINEDGKRHGKGVMIYQNGRRYEGFWVNDIRHGRGFEKHSNGNAYTGQFFDGKAHGFGIFKWTNGELYDGQWDKGVRSGKGIWKGTAPDNLYVGDWKRNKAEGVGTYTWPNGDRYDGEWLACLKNGKGTDFFANGDRYVGNYENGKPNGEGIYTWQSGSQYEGQFLNGLKHGSGTWKKNNDDIKCNRYIGEYENDKKQGYGEFFWQSGNIYKGNYNNDEREGFGEMIFTDGTIYKGNWLRGLQSGRGTLIQPDGTVKEGFFKNNIFYGENSPTGSPIPSEKSFGFTKQDIKNLSSPKNLKNSQSQKVLLQRDNIPKYKKESFTQLPPDTDYQNLRQAELISEQRLTKVLSRDTARAGSPNEVENSASSQGGQRQWQQNVSKLPKEQLPQIQLNRNSSVQALKSKPPFHQARKVLTQSIPNPTQILTTQRQFQQFQNGSNATGHEKTIPLNNMNQQQHQLTQRKTEYTSNIQNKFVEQQQQIKINNGYQNKFYSNIRQGASSKNTKR